MATEDMKKRAHEFEKTQNRLMGKYVADRSRRVKREGFRSESDYFKNTNPFRNSDKPKKSVHSPSKSKALAKKIPKGIEKPSSDQKSSGLINN